MSEYMQLVTTSCKEVLWPPYLLFCYATTFAQIVHFIYLSTNKYLDTYTPSSSIYTRVHGFLSLLAFEAL